MNQVLFGPALRALEAASPVRSARPVFLHGMWRSGSTFVWSRFRQSDKACCYYEPLHPGLGRLTRRRIPRDTAELTAANRHPPLDRPYFAEYEPLVGLRGVRGFDRRFTFDRFAMTGDSVHEPLRRYVARLTRHAESQGRVAVLGFNQTGLRIGWLRRAFGSYDIQVERDPRDIWLSYMEHRMRGNFTYFRMWLQVAERNAAHPLFAPLAQRLPLRAQGKEWLIKPKPYYAAITKVLSPETLYQVVVYAWMACALHALSACDLVIDTSLAGQAGYTARLSDVASSGTGLDVDFQGLRTVPPATDMALARADAIERETAALFPVAAAGALFDLDRVRRRLSHIAPRKAALLSLLL